jgi:hypothetical protein
MPLSAAPERQLRANVVVIAVSIALLVRQHLYRSHVCAVRSLEVARLGRVAALAVVVGLLATLKGQRSRPRADEMPR